MERGGKPRDVHRWRHHRFMAFDSWYDIFVRIIELKHVEFVEFRGCQPGVHHVGYVQVACRDAEVVNGAPVGGDDGSGEFKTMDQR